MSELKGVVRCETKEQWAEVNESLPVELRQGTGSWHNNKGQTCKHLNSKRFGTVETYQYKKTKIYSFEEWKENLN